LPVRSAQTLGDMNTRFRFAIAAYLALWAAIAGGFIYGVVQAGISVWVAVGSAFLLFVLVNGSLAYGARVRQLRLEGKEPPRYLQYLFLPQGLPKLRQEAPRSTHLLVLSVPRRHSPAPSSSFAESHSLLTLSGHASRNRFSQLLCVSFWVALALRFSTFHGGCFPLAGRARPMSPNQLFQPTAFGGG
jgi:hypothetical protein